MNADLGEVDTRGRLIRYQPRGRATTRREAFVVDEAEVIRWAHEISVDVERPSKPGA
jgi:hypothetical protein